MNLFYFHYLNEEQRKQILIESANCLIRSNDCISQFYKKDPIPINLINRILIICHYIMHHFNEPSLIIIQTIETNLLNIFQNNDLKCLNQSFTSKSLELLHKLNKSNELDLYSLTNSSFENESTFNVSDMLIKENLYELFYSTLVNMTGLSMSFNNQDKESSKLDNYLILYNFAYSWSLIDPRNASIPTRNEFVNSLLINIIFDEKKNLNKTLLNSIETNTKTIQLFRIAFKSKISEQIQDLKLINNPDLPDVSFDFFIKFWNLKLNDLLNISIDEQKEENYRILFSNLELLNYHLNLLELTDLSFEMFNDLVNLVTKLILNCKSYFKQFILIKKHLKIEDNNNVLKNVITQILNISKATNLEQLNNSECLIDLFGSNLINHDYFKDVNTCLTELNKEKNDQNIESTIDLVNYKQDFELYITIMNRFFFNESSFDLVLINLTSLLNKLFNSIEKRKDYIENNNLFTPLINSIEHLFMNLNGDLNCFKLLEKNVFDFFNSSLSIEINTKQAKQIDLDLYFNLNKSRYEYYLLSKISSFTYDIIYKLCTSYYLTTHEANDTKMDNIFQQLLKYIENSLDSPNGILGFCEFFGSTTSNCSTPLLEEKPSKMNLIETTTNKFLIFISTSSSSNSSQEYFIQILSILNKLFKINYNLAQQLKQTEDDNSETKSNESTTFKKLNKVLAQINQIADLDTEFLQKWLSKLVLPNENESDSLIQSLKSNVSILKSKYVFKQLAMHLVNEKVNNILSEVVTLSVLSALIQSASKLLNTYNGNGFSDLISLMDILSCAGSGNGHLYLFQASCIWLEYLSTIDLEKKIKSKKDNNNLNNDTFIQSACCILSYISEILNSISLTKNQTSLNTIDSTITDDFNQSFQHNFFIDFNKENQKMFDFIQMNEDSNKQTTQSISATIATTTTTNKTTSDNNASSFGQSGVIKKTKKRNNLKRFNKMTRRSSSSQQPDENKNKNEKSNKTDNETTIKTDRFSLLESENGVVEDDEDEDEHEQYLNNEPNNSYLDEYSENDKENNNYETDDDDEEENQEDDFNEDDEEEDTYDENYDGGNNNNNEYINDEDVDDDEDDDDDDDNDDDNTARKISGNIYI